MAIAQPSWYAGMEKWLLQGKPVIVGALLGIAGVSLYFAYQVGTNEKYAAPAAAWATYMLMP